MHRYSVFGTILFALILLLGCGSKEEKIKVTGTVKLDETNLQIGLVRFESEVNKEEFTSAQIMPDGTFTVYAITPGKYRVAVKTSIFASMAVASKMQAKRNVIVGKMKGRFRAVSPKYENANTSGLVVEVEDGKSIDLVLKSGK